MAVPNKVFSLLDVDTALLENDRLHIDSIPPHVDCPSAASSRLGIVRHRPKAYREKPTSPQYHLFIAAGPLRSVMSIDGRDAETTLTVQLQQGITQ